MKDPGKIESYCHAKKLQHNDSTTDQVSMLVANIRTLFSTQGTYTGLGNGQAVKFGIVPNDMYNAKSLTGNYASNAQFSLKNAFGGEVYIKPSDLSAAKDDGAFTIEYTNLSTEACVTIVTGDWGSGQGSGLVGITAGAGSDSYENSPFNDLDTFHVGDAEDTIGSPDTHGGNSGTPTPVAVAKAIEWCDVSDGSTPAVAWKYY